MTGFDFVVRQMSWLRHVPAFPQLFDAALVLWSGVRHPDRLRAIEELEAAALRLDHVQLLVHRLGGVGFGRAGVEFAHVHGNGLLDVKIGRARARELISKGQALPHHVFGDSAWVSYWLSSRADLPGALRLLELGVRRMTNDE